VQGEQTPDAIWMADIRVSDEAFATIIGGTRR